MFEGFLIHFYAFSAAFFSLLSLSCVIYVEWGNIYSMIESHRRGTSDAACQNNLVKDFIILLFAMPSFSLSRRLHVKAKK